MSRTGRHVLDARRGSPGSAAGVTRWGRAVSATEKRLFLVMNVPGPIVPWTIWVDGSAARS